MLPHGIPGATLQTASLDQNLSTCRWPTVVGVQGLLQVRFGVMRNLPLPGSISHAHKFRLRHGPSVKARSSIQGATARSTANCFPSGFGVHAGLVGSMPDLSLKERCHCLGFLRCPKPSRCRESWSTWKRLANWSTSLTWSRCLNMHGNARSLAKIGRHEGAGK